MTQHGLGQFFVLGFDGLRAPASLKKVAAQHGLGGVILFDRNIESQQQLRYLTKELRSLSPEAPLLISIDQEGGHFQRLKPPRFEAFPPACEITQKTAYEVGKRMGQELASLGITLDNAPVLDVNTNPDNPIIGVRSFGSDPHQVAAVGKLFIRGMQEAGVMACGKHFPGHGDTHQDSHVTLPVVNHLRERLEEVEFYPFRQLISEGLHCVMTAHVLYPALDIDLPATFSEKILNNLLRKEWGYKGLVITDDLGMAGAASRGDVPEACVAAFAAGCDLLLVCEHLERHEEIIEALEKEIEKSLGLQKRAAESLTRIQKANPRWNF